MQPVPMHPGRAVQWFSFAVGPPIHIGEVWLILPAKQNSRLLKLHERPRAGRCQWNKRPGAVFLPERRSWLCLDLYLGCREGDVGTLWLVILLGQVVGAEDSFGALSLGCGHMGVVAGIVLLDTAVTVVMGRYLVIWTPHTTSAASTVVLPPSARLLLMFTILLLMMPNWMLPLLLAAGV